MDSEKHEDLEFAYRSGHINPLQVANPGLVYDTNVADYVNFLCKQGYNITYIKLITGVKHTFCNNIKLGRAWDLNYPTFSVAVEDGLQIKAVFKRTVTNVGSPNSTCTLSMYNCTCLPLLVLLWSRLSCHSLPLERRNRSL